MSQLMNFEPALRAVAAGDVQVKMRRTLWKPNEHVKLVMVDGEERLMLWLQSDTSYHAWTISRSDLEATDWEVVGQLEASPPSARQQQRKQWYTREPMPPGTPPMPVPQTQPDAAPAEPSGFDPNFPVAPGEPGDGD